MSNDIADGLNLGSNFTPNNGELRNISDEIIPQIKTLISLCASHGIFIKILNRSTVLRKSLIKDLGFDFTAAFEATTNYIDLSYHNFGLAFGVGIYECCPSGKLKYLDHQHFYNKVGKLGESIGFTWAGNHPLMSNLRYFEFRPAWAKGMDDKEMINELYRRKEAKTSLTA